MATDLARGECGRVVVGVDGSESARHAALWAGWEAETRDVPLIVLHAFGSGGHQDERRREQQMLDEVAAAIRKERPGLPIETELSALTPVERLVELSRDGALIVTATHGRGALAGLLLGSVSRALVARTLGPLVVVRGPRAEENTGPVVLGVDPEPFEAAVRYAFSAAQRYGSSLDAVRTWKFEPPAERDSAVELPGLAPAGLGIRGATLPPATAHRQEERDHAEQREAAALDSALETAQRRYPDVRVDITPIEGDPAEVLASTGEHARLVVVGAPRHHRRILSRTPGHVVAKLLAHCPAPVAVIPDSPD